MPRRERSRGADNLAPVSGRTRTFIWAGGLDIGVGLSGTVIPPRPFRSQSQNTLLSQRNQSPKASFSQSPRLRNMRPRKAPGDSFNVSIIRGLRSCPGLSIVPDNFTVVQR